MKRIFIYLAVAFSLLSFSSGLRAQVKDSLWNDAVNAYSGADYQTALRSFQELEKEGYLSAGLYYNIGNAYYKLGNYNAKSILYYERALRMNPSYEDAAHNLELARQYTLDKIDVVPEFVLISWTKSLCNSLSSNSWAYLSLGLFALTAFLLIVFRFGGSLGLRKVAFIFSIITIVFAIICFSFSMSLNNKIDSEDHAIIMVPVSSVKSSPNESGQSLFILHEGTKVEIIDQLGDWNRIELSDGRQGWLQKRDIEII